MSYCNRSPTAWTFRDGATSTAGVPMASIRCGSRSKAPVRPAFLLNNSESRLHVSRSFAWPSE